MNLPYFILGLFFIVISLMLLVNILMRIKKSNIYDHRFIVLTSKVSLLPEDDLDENLSDDLRRIIGENRKDANVKVFDTEVIIDLEEVLFLQAWTNSKYEDDEVYLNATKIVLKSGDVIFANEPLPTVEGYLASYLYHKNISTWKI